MFTFDMKVEQNFASFIDRETGVSVFVDSFDNIEFEVRVGTLSKSDYAGVIRATDDYTLNQKLHELTKDMLH